MKTRFEFESLLSLLGRSENDPAIRQFFGRDIFMIDRDEYYGTLEFKSEGVDVVFNEAPWVVPPEQVRDPKELWLAAFHLYREGHQGFAQYQGELPNRVVFGDSEHDLLRKLGEPLKRGGGVISSFDGQSIPRWFWFTLGKSILHLQLDGMGRVDMATLQVPEIKLASSLSDKS